MTTVHITFYEGAPFDVEADDLAVSIDDHATRVTVRYISAETVHTMVWPFLNVQLIAVTEPHLDDTPDVSWWPPPATDQAQVA